MAIVDRLTRASYTEPMSVLEDVSTISLPLDQTIEQEFATGVADDLFEMANLPVRQTGIPGYVFISTSMGRHGPRVKYFQNTGRGQPSFSVAISHEPTVIANSLPGTVVSKIAPLVIRWVRLNHDPLLRFWEHGVEMDDDEVTNLKSGLQKLV